MTIREEIANVLNDHTGEILDEYGEGVIADGVTTADYDSLIEDLGSAFQYCLDTQGYPGPEVTCYVTFGSKYRHEPHPIDPRAHPDGWFEFIAPSYEEARMEAVKYFWVNAPTRVTLEQDEYTYPTSGAGVALFADDYSADNWEPKHFERGCLARFRVTFRPVRVGSREVEL